MSRGSGSARRLAVSAAAKVNLALEVLGRRDDGYHEIVTVMQTVDLCDRLVLEEAAECSLDTGAPGLPTDATNLALKAALALREAAGIARGVRITLDKRIPIAAGLGGGSADAAAVLAGLNRLWGLRWPRARLAEVATRLGMDVPFFLRGGVALATGRGERVEPLSGPPLALVLVNPRFPVPTREVYARVEPRMYGTGDRVRELVGALGTRRAARVAASLYNGLERVVAGTHPQITQMEAALLAAGALGAVMSGSGPTVLGVARSFDHARQIRARITRGSWGCWAVRALRGPAVRIRRASLGRGQAARRGTLDPVFGGSNPPAPTRLE